MTKTLSPAEWQQKKAKGHTHVGFGGELWLLELTDAGTCLVPVEVDNERGDE